MLSQGVQIFQRKNWDTNNALIITYTNQHRDDRLETFNYLVVGIHMAQRHWF